MSIVFDESIMIIVILSIFWLVVCCHRPCAVSGQWHLRLALAPSNVSVRHLKLLLFCCVSWIVIVQKQLQIHLANGSDEAELCPTGRDRGSA